MITRHFPPEFLFGTATAATQIEGGVVPSSWDRWSTTPGNIKDGTTSRRACDHWNRVDEDIQLQKDLGCQTYRMGLDWARIEPQECHWDFEVLEHYRGELKALVAAGIRPLVTLHHFSNPLWMEDQSGWLNPLAPLWFDRFTDVVLRHLGDLVSDWITINEPNVYLVKGYQYGEWPPGLKDRGDLVLKGAKNFINAHIHCYKTIHRIRKEKNWPGKTMVGAAHHLRIFQGDKGSLAHLSAKIHKQIFQGIFLEGMTKGHLVFPLGSGHPWGKGTFCDFIGVNYYSRDMIRGKLSALPVLGLSYTHGEFPKNDLGWEIHPEGLGVLCRQLWKKYKLPLWITENGTADSSDRFRSQFLVDHLNVIAQIRDEGVPVERYYHWTLLDNFEWAEGESARFGLVHTDFETQTRTIRPSGHLFAQIAKTRNLKVDD